MVLLQAYLLNANSQKALLQAIQYILISTLPDFPIRARFTGLRRLQRMDKGGFKGSYSLEKVHGLICVGER